eukprot:TRINITY_DN33432_c0_g1_i2.p1 TRINITY_DN33432_c0_g1~~TRINITY_DN33432_c0_g1_i2.p1  ORF type:complete len:927 (+),score=175.40 TRINITY_DN33432_c0_g1_i2:60-2840(+)
MVDSHADFTPAKIYIGRCFARVWGSGRGGQCPKPRRPSSDFCGTHGGQKPLPHGRVDGPVPAAKLQEFLRAAGGRQAAVAAMQPLETFFQRSRGRALEHAKRDSDIQMPKMQSDFKQEVDSPGKPSTVQPEVSETAVESAWTASESAAEPKQDGGECRSAKARRSESFLQRLAGSIERVDKAISGMKTYESTEPGEELETGSEALEEERHPSSDEAEEGTETLQEERHSSSDAAEEDERSELLEEEEERCSSSDEAEDVELQQGEWVLLEKLEALIRGWADGNRSSCRGVTSRAEKTYGEDVFLGGSLERAGLSRDAFSFALAVGESALTGAKVKAREANEALPYKKVSMLSLESSADSPPPGGQPVTIVAGGGVTVHADSNKLSSASTYVSTLLQGRFGDSSNHILASEFPVQAVQAVVDFTHEGKCLFGIDDVDAVFALADRWLMTSVQEALLYTINEPDSLLCLQLIASWEVDVARPQNLISALLARSKQCLLDLTIMALKAEKAVCCQMAEELTNACCKGSPADSTVYGWLLADRSLRDAAEGYLKATVMRLLQVGVKHPCQPHLAKSLEKVLDMMWPASLTGYLAMNLCRHFGLFRNCGVFPWTHWVCASHRGLGWLLRLYMLLRISATRTLSRQDSELSWQTLRLTACSVKQLPQEMEELFGRAIADSLQKTGDREFLRVWREMVSDAPGAWPAIHVAVHCCAHFLTAHSLHASLSAFTVNHILCLKAVSLRPSMLRLNGPAPIAGIYRRSQENEFKRCISAPAAEEFVLRRVRRTPSSIVVHYPGVPRDLRLCRSEWQIQKALDDPEVDTPVALALDDHLSTQLSCPSLKARWWHCRGEDFTEVPVSLCTQEADWQELAVPVDALAAWAAGAGAHRLDQLHRIASAPVVRQMLREAAIKLAHSPAESIRLSQKRKRDDA